MEKIISHLKRSKHVFIASHVNPDGDAVGSLIAAALMLETLGKKVTMYNESLIPAVYRFLPDTERIVSDFKEFDTCDTAVVLDCGDIRRVGKIAEHLSRIPVLINIDHHVTNTRFGDLNCIDTQACATAEILYRFITMMNIPVTKALANAIYTGIVTDTGSFRFANTNKAAFSICDEMVAKGVEPYTVAQHLYGTYSLGRLKLLNLALNSIEILHNGQVSFMTLTKDMLEETGTQSEDIDGMIHYAKRIKDVKVAVLIQERCNGLKNGQGRNSFHVSLRSDGAVDVAALAASFGGGGHQRAAGFSAEMNLSNLKTGIINWLSNAQSGSDGA
ncbi:MAG: bifunctional oligoribonuclease/PAP phosphatase NrnA [Desulfococcaceae bacterium]